MSVTGGRGIHRLCVAGALLLLLAPILPVTEAQSPSDPWWGPTDRARPTEGWAIRIPVLVENRYDHPLRDPFIAADLDIAKLLVEAGWTNQTLSTSAGPRGFTLDVDSIRVVPYARGFSGPRDGPATKPVPHRFYPAMFEESRARLYFEPTRPAGTVLFQHDGLLQPGERLAYYVYANPLEYVDTPAPSFDPLEASPLDSFLWGTRGNVYYGFVPFQEGQGNILKIQPMTGLPTRVTVSVLELGRFVPVASTPVFSNPFTLQGMERNVNVPANKFYRIESDRPVLVVARGDTGSEAFGHVPGRSGSYADDTFDVYGFPNTRGTVNLRLYKASPGTVTVTGASSGSVSLTPSEPYQSITIQPNTWSTLSGSGKFLVSLSLPGERNVLHTVQVPAVTGGPSGTTFYTGVHNDEGFARICPAANATVRIVDDGREDSQIYPEGTLPGAPAAKLSSARLCERAAMPRVASPGATYRVSSTKEPSDTSPGAPAPLKLVVGTGPRVDYTQTPPVNLTRAMIGQFYGGDGGVDYTVESGAVIFGHYNGTRLTVFEERLRDGVPVITNRTIGIERDAVITICKDSTVQGCQIVPSADSTLRFRIVATKPVSVASQDSALVNQVDASGAPFTQNVGYVRYVPGRPQMPDVEVGRLEFRGPLVDLRSPARAGTSDTVTTGPGSPVSYRLNVLNLGRWVGNADLTDTITISCAAPAGWTVEGCNKDVSLSTGSAQRLDVVVTPAMEDVNKLLPVEVTARSKSGGAAAVFTLRVKVSIVYGVGMWFDVEGGRKTIDPPMGLDPGETHRFNIVVKNTGSTTDTIHFRVDPAQEGWTQELQLDGAPRTSVRLDGGESRTLQLLVRAPNLETARQNIVSIVGQSESSALAADRVNTAARIKPKVDLDVVLTPQTRLAAPNETTAFNLTLCNKGNDIFTIYLRQDSILPEGWKANFSTQRIGDELTLNRNPGCADPLENITVQLFVTPPPGARAGDLASVKLAADIDTGGAGGRVAGAEVAAVVVVRRVYNLTTPPMPDIAVLPGRGVQVVLPVENQGNGQVSLELLSGAVEALLLSEDGSGRALPDWRVALESDAITLALNESGEVPLRLDVPRGAPPGLYNLTFTTRLSREAVQNLTIPVEVKELAQVDLEGVERLAFTPGRPVVVPFVARNNGNLDGTFELGASPPAGWNATFSPPRVRLAPGERADVALTLSAPLDAADALYNIPLATSAAGREPTQRDLAASIARPQLRLDDIDASGRLRPGELVLVTATVANAGGIAADNVSVALVVDGRVVDTVTLSRIPIGSSAVATLTWVSTQRGGDVRVVVDPEEQIALAERAQATEATVKFGSFLGVPGPGPAATLAVALGLALALARRRWGA